MGTRYSIGRESIECMEDGMLERVADLGNASKVLQIILKYSFDGEYYSNMGTREKIKSKLKIGDTSLSRYMNKLIDAGVLIPTPHRGRYLIDLSPLRIGVKWL